MLVFIALMPHMPQLQWSVFNDLNPAFEQLIAGVSFALQT